MTEAKVNGPVADKMRKLNPAQRKVELHRMLQALLVDRLKLGLHRETKQLPGYVLIVEEDGSKLKESRPNGRKGLTANPWSE